MGYRLIISVSILSLLLTACFGRLTDRMKQQPDRMQQPDSL